MTIKEMDEQVLKHVDSISIMKEIHRLEGRLDFLLFCEDIPEDIRQREREKGWQQMEILRAKLKSM